MIKLTLASNLLGKTNSKMRVAFSCKSFLLPIREFSKLQTFQANADCYLSEWQLTKNPLNIIQPNVISAVKRWTCNLENVKRIQFFFVSRTIQSNFVALALQDFELATIKFRCQHGFCMYCREMSSYPWCQVMAAQNSKKDEVF